MAARPLFGILALVLLAGGILLQFFIILSGAVNSNPEDQIYFLESSTNGIPNARNPSRWTYFAMCGVGANGRNADCGAKVPAFPFQPTDRHNFGTATGVPAGFLGTNRFWYLSRFAWVFYLIALVFAVMALFTGLLALFSRLGGYLSGLNTMIALFFQTLAAALMTAWTILARNTFNSSGQTARLGVKAYAFSWAPVACFFLSTVLFCLGGAASRKDNTYSSTKSTRKRGGFFGRKRSTRSQGSFLDSESQRHVKDETSY